MRPRVVTVFAITGFCLSSELAAAAAQGGLCSRVGGNALFTPSHSHLRGSGKGVPLAQEGLYGGRERPQARSSHHFEDVTCFLLPSQEKEHEHAPTLPQQPQQLLGWC